MEKVYPNEHQFIDAPDEAKFYSPHIITIATGKDSTASIVFNPDSLEDIAIYAIKNVESLAYLKQYLK